MPEKAAFFHFYSAFCFIPREISGLVGVKATDPVTFTTVGGLLPDLRNRVLAAGATRCESRPDDGFARRVTVFGFEIRPECHVAAGR
jgi:hypothetical protein